MPPPTRPLLAVLLVLAALALPWLERRCRMGSRSATQNFCRPLEYRLRKLLARRRRTDQESRQRPSQRRRAA